MDWGRHASRPSTVDRSVEMLSLGKQPLWLKDAEFALSMVERQQSDAVRAIMFNRADDHILATALPRHVSYTSAIAAQTPG